MKNGDSTIDIAGVMDKPFAEAASAALLSVPWWQVIGPRHFGRRMTMQCEREIEPAIPMLQCASAYPTRPMATMIEPVPA